MGGSALSFETRRVKRDEYDMIVDTIKRIIKRSGIDVSQISDIPFYREKESFGDIDFLIVSDEPNRRDWISRLFTPKEIYHNTNVYSFDYKDVQIDFIFTSLESYQPSIHYFSYNDLGNLIGRIAHKMGLKYGHDGLWYTMRDGDYVVADILLSRDVDKILPFLGYAPKKFHEGFDSLLEIFEYVVSSPYYNYEIFDLENRNYRARTRDRKRKTYTEFLKWAQENPKKDLYQWNKDKSVYLDNILDTFGVREIYEAHYVANEQRKRLKEVFNGNIVSSITGLTGKELGAFMTKFKEVFRNDDLLRMTPEIIKAELENVYRTWGFDD